MLRFWWDFGTSLTHLQSSTAIINVACNPQGSEGWLLTLHGCFIQKSVLHVLPGVPLSTPLSRTFFLQHKSKHFACSLKRKEKGWWKMQNYFDLWGSLSFPSRTGAALALKEMGGREGRSNCSPWLFPQPPGPGAGWCSLQQEQLPPSFPVPGQNPRQLQEDSEKDLKHIQYSAE